MLSCVCRSERNQAQTLLISPEWFHCIKSKSWRTKLTVRDRGYLRGETGEAVTEGVSRVAVMTEFFLSVVATWVCSLCLNLFYTTGFMCLPICLVYSN